MGLALLLASHARAQDLLHYEPPAVEFIYPLDGGVEYTRSADAGVRDLTPAIVLSIDAGAPPSQREDEPEFGATATVQRAPPAGAREVGNESARDLPGSFGDPLRILDALPGVVPIASGVPYVYVRGAPPSSTGYVYDDIPLPQLYHVGFGPAVIHPRATGAVRFQAGVPSARYGRRAGGLLLAEGTPYDDQFDAEAELRLIDVGGWLQGKLGKGALTLSGRIGYPAAVALARGLGVLNSGTRMNYWDGQLRYRYPITRRDQYELVWLGSFDSIHLPGVSSVPGAGATDLQFQRVENRYLHRFANDLDFGVALRFGYDRSALGSAVKVRANNLGPRFWIEKRFARARVRVGGDMQGSVGSIVNGTGSLASPEGDLRIRLPQIAAAAARNQGGLFIESDLSLLPKLRAELGARVDYWHVEQRTNVAVDPRIRLTFNATDKLELHAAFGLGHQPSVFFLPLPGLTEVALDRGLTRATQYEVGVAYMLPADIRFEVQGYLHQYTRLLLPELVMDADIEDQPPLSDAIAYGLEFFLKRELGKLSGWISYTLGEAKADAFRSPIGKFRPDFDVRHVLNVVAQWRVWRGLTMGGRLHARSGRVIEQLSPQYKQRLPWFVRPDVRIGYAWRGRWGDMVAYLEWLNVAAQGEYLDADCVFQQCTAVRAPRISIPNLGLRADF
ncbi:MAG TPA: TonB-dependent receptor [Polyangiales bacterium]|nr:TonB-dependent receptor [Polyangiales bacterium]